MDKHDIFFSIGTFIVFILVSYGVYAGSLYMVNYICLELGFGCAVNAGMLILGIIAVIFTSIFFLAHTCVPV